MITFLTGAPGGGKTLYTVWNLLRPLIGQVVREYQDDGTFIEWKRKVYTNIRGLLLDHELITHDHLANWWEWAEPGSVVVIDEVQKRWLPRPNGSKRPQDVAELEEHRGKWSVDFIIISQHPNLVDRDVQNLVGRHLHLRRVGNLPLSIVYEWDMTSRTLAFKNAFSKKPIWFNSAAYRLYKSARVHTKSPKKLPTLAYVIVAAVALAAWKIPESWARITGKNEQHALNAQSPSDGVNHSPNDGRTVLAPKHAASAPISPPDVQQSFAAGCIASSARCACFDAQGILVQVAEHLCRAGSQTTGLRVLAER